VWLLGLVGCEATGPQPDRRFTPDTPAAVSSEAWRESACAPTSSEQGWTYVAPDQVAGEGSLDRPFTGVQEALDHGAGKIVLLPGTHASPEGVLEEPLVLRGACVDEVVLKGGLESEASLTLSGLQRVGSTWLRAGTLSVDDCLFRPDAERGVGLSGGEDAVIEVHGSRFEGTDYGVYGLGRTLVEDCVFEDVQPGAAVYSEGTTVVRGSVFRDAPDGLGVWSTWGSTLVEDCSFEDLEYGVWRSNWKSWSADTTVLRSSTLVRTNVGSAGASLALFDVRIHDPVGPAIEVIETSPDGFPATVYAEDVEIEALDASHPAVLVAEYSWLEAERLRVTAAGRGVDIDSATFICRDCALHATEVAAMARDSRGLDLQDCDLSGAWGLVYRADRADGVLRRSSFEGTTAGAALTAPLRLVEADFVHSPIGLVVAGELPDLEQARFEDNALDLWVQSCPGEPPETPEGLSASICEEALELPE
jgi:hypothetical protein